jgi:hypothetical protein
VTEAKSIEFRQPLSWFDRVRVHFAAAHFTWRWLWAHKKDNVTIRYSVDED